MKNPALTPDRKTGAAARMRAPALPLHASSPQRPPSMSPQRPQSMNGGVARRKRKRKAQSSGVHVLLLLQGRLRALIVIGNYLTQPRISCPLAWMGLFGVPLLFFGGVPRSVPGSMFQNFVNAWDSLLHVSCYLVASVTFLGAMAIAYTTTSDGNTAAFISAESTVEDGLANKTPINKNSSNKFAHVWTFVATPARLSLIIIIIFLESAAFCSYRQVVSPGWLCNPFLILFRYRVYWPEESTPALKGLCLDYKLKEEEELGKDPLCLSEESWNILSAGALSGRNREDVETVLKGLDYVQHVSGGVVIGVMGRDVSEHVHPLRLNVESLQHLIPNLSLVAFENDSKDGTREHFKAWQQDPIKAYKVDLIECPEAENCVFGKSHRYDAKESKNFFASSTIGEMHKFRQRLVDHIMTSPVYDNYSHLLLLDLDIGVSISPLGILHSLGSVQNSAIASSCRQPWPGGLGTLVPPYDFNAFESITTRDTEWFKSLHEKFCALMPPGDRWRFVCQAASPMKFLQIIQLDRANNYPYAVESAYNGATLYPLQLIREAKPKYDAGDDGQRCEHVSFNRGLKKAMFVNPKWDMHMSPTLPGGPKGEQALKHFRRFGMLPQIAIPMFLFNFIPLATLVLSIMTLSVYYLTKARQRFCHQWNVATNQSSKKS